MGCDDPHPLRQEIPDQQAFRTGRAATPAQRVRSIRSSTTKRTPLCRLRTGLCPRWRRVGTFPTYANRLLATVVDPTHADHVHRNLSTLSGERVPPRVHDPHLRDLDHLTASTHELGHHPRCRGAIRRLRFPVSNFAQTAIDQWGIKIRVLEPMGAHMAQERRDLEISLLYPDLANECCD